MYDFISKTQREKHNKLSLFKYTPTSRGRAGKHARTSAPTPTRTETQPVDKENVR